MGMAMLGSHIPDPPFTWSLRPGEKPDLSTPLVHIYALIDPFTGTIRYIGKSIRPDGRFKDHCNDKANTHRTHWIQSVLRRGRRPRLIVLDSFPESFDWQEAERRWIAWARAKGEPLTNGTDGGDGVVGLSPESRARITAAWKGRKHSPETLAKLSIIRRGRKHTAQWRENMSVAMKGREITPSHRKALSKSIRKLTDDQAREVRRRLAAGDLQKTIAADFNVDKGTISNIKRRVCYRDVE